jgi:hypothetical protein
MMKHLLSSAAEDEVGSIFINAKEVVPFRVPTASHSYSDRQFDRIWDSEQQSQSETVQSNGHDICYWIKDRIEQGQYRVYWEPGSYNLADYFTKHHSSAHHKIMHGQYVQNLHAPVIRYNANASLKHTSRVCRSQL